MTVRCTAQAWLAELLAVLLAVLLSSASWSQTPAIIRSDSIQHPVLGDAGMVATQHHIASRIGAQVLSAGGNAVDAAVAVGFALAVVLPRAGNLGGGGFMMVYLADSERTIAIDYREAAPALAHRDMFLDADGELDRTRALFSHSSAGVPGTVAGLLYAQEKYGTLPLRLILKPAYELARDGFTVTHDLQAALHRARHLKKNPEARSVFYSADGSPVAAGSLLRQPELANSLRLIMKRGSDGFYRGETAQRLVEDMRAHGGFIRQRDLETYQPVERAPVMGTYRGYRIASMPPPSSGGVHLVQLLNILEGFPLSEYGYGSRDAIHVMTEAMKWAYADRSKYLGDPDFVDVPVSRLTDKHYAERLAKAVDLERATPSESIAPGHWLDLESHDTTHYSVVDVDGNAVANTYTLNFSFGSGIMIPGTGILLNNEMDDFAAREGAANAYGLVGGHANRIEPGKRPLSSMTPTLVFREHKPILVTGSPGGSRIITTVLQILVNVIDHGMNIADAVSAPRFHHQWQPDRLFMEKGFSPDTRRLLESSGHEISQVRSMGSAQSIMLGEQYMQGVADPRKPDALAQPALN